MANETKSAKARAYLNQHPNATPKEIAAASGASLPMVYNLRHRVKAPAKPSKLGKVVPDKVVRPSIAPAPISAPADVDPVNNPAHYTDGGIETIDYIEAKGLGYHLGNVVKYVSRAGKKDPSQNIEDLRKAQWYLSRAIEKTESATAK